MKKAFGITLSEESHRDTITQKSLDRVSEFYYDFKDETPEYIDYMIANHCQNLSNRQIAAAYKFLGIFDVMKDATSVKRALKSYSFIKSIK